MTAIDFPGIRQAIANTLSTIPEIRKVNLYEFRGESRSNLPYASILRLGVTAPPVTITGEQVGLEGLGQYSHLIEWQLRVYANFRGQAEAEANDDLYATRLLDAFNSDRLLGGTVDLSKLSAISPFWQIDNNAPIWITEASLETIAVSLT